DRRLELADIDGTARTEMAALPCVAWASLHGVAFDRAGWEALAAEAEAETDRLAELLDTLAPNAATLTHTTNWNAGGQVRAAFAALGITLDSTDDDHLAALDHPLSAALREYRAAARRRGTYGTK